MDTERYQSLMDAVRLVMDRWDAEPGPMQSDARRAVGHLLEEAGDALEESILSEVFCAEEVSE